MIVQQFFVGGLAHSSYLLGGTGACASVEPRRDVAIYLDAAKALGMRITHILETHLHADFISGHLDLAEATGARIYAPQSAGCRFDHVAVAEGDSFDLDDLALRVLEMPGHTPEHISYVVSDRARGPEPVGVFCGDTLFVGAATSRKSDIHKSDRGGEESGCPRGAQARRPAPRSFSSARRRVVGGGLSADEAEWGAERR